MSEGFNFSNILLIIAGVMLATTLFVVVLVFFARWFHWSISVAERCSALLISCEHCG
jgi:TRAP-type C4-dicarboxylate transport system permease small subunit